MGEPGTGSGPRALVTDGGTGQGRSALAAVRLLAAAGWAPVVTTTGRWSLAASSRWCAGIRRQRGLADGPAAYAEDLAATIASERFDAVVPASDGALEALGSPVAPLLDKANLAAAAAAVGLSTPPTRAFDSWAALVEEAGALDYPVVVKPRRTTEPARAFDDAGALRAAPPAGGPVLVQARVLDGMWSVSGVVQDGRLLAAAHQRYERTWPHPCGTASAAVTVEADPAVEGLVVALLGEHGGVFQAQFAGSYLLDLNPRVYGSLPLAAAAGVNLVAIACDTAAGRAAAPATTLRARAGVRYRWLEGDLRHVAQAVRSRSLGVGGAVGALRPRLGIVHSVTTVRDPRPLLARVAHAAGARR